MMTKAKDNIPVYLQNSIIRMSETCNSAIKGAWFSTQNTLQAVC